MKSFSNKTLDDALKEASLELGIEIDQLVYVVKEEKKGLFSKKVCIDVYELSDVIDFIEQYLVNAIDALGIQATAKASLRDEIIKVSLDSDHNSILIGKNGRTLQALNELVRLATSNRFKKRFRILLDINEYKDDKYAKIVSIARRVAFDVQKTKVTASLDAMPADERRVIHNALNGMPHIKTESVGEGRERQITIIYVE